MGKNKNKKVSEQLKALVEANAPETKELTYKIGDDELKFLVYPVIPFAERCRMIQEIVDNMFMGDKNNINTYTPEYFTFVKKNVILSYYTNLVLPTKLNDAWLVFACTQIYEDVVEAVGKEEIDDVLKSVENGVEAYKQYLISKTDMNMFINKITSAIGDINSNITEEGVSNLMSKLDKMSSSGNFKNIVDTLLNN